MVLRAAEGIAGPPWKTVQTGFRILFVRAWHLRRWGHDHMGAPWWRWYWNDRPGMRIGFGTDEWSLEPNHIYLIPPNTDFRGYLDKPCRHLSIPFVLGDTCRVAPIGPQQVPIEPWLSMQQLQRHLDVLSDSATDTQQLTIEQTLSLQGMVLAAISRLAPDSWSRQALDKRVQFVRSQLLKDLLSPPSNEQLAEDLGIHPATLVRLCKQQLGYSPQRYALRIRLQGACEDLVEDGLTVEDVAERWGFSDRQHLTRQMKQHFFCTPGSLRRQRNAPR